jgi:hypothetical protein
MAQLAEIASKMIGFPEFSSLTPRAGAGGSA